MSEYKNELLEAGLVEAVEPDSKGSYALRNRCMFLTYSNITSEKNADLLLQSMNKFIVGECLYGKPVQYVSVCVEEHESGVLHCHVLVCFKTATRLAVNYQAFYNTNRPRLEKVRNLKAALA